MERLTPLLPPPVESLWLSYLGSGARYFFRLLGKVVAPTQREVQEALEDLAREGWEAIMEDLESAAKPCLLNWRAAMLIAAYNGHMRAIELCVRKGEGDWIAVMVEAASGGQKEVILECEKYIKPERRWWQEALEGASEKGHKDIMHLCESRGAKDWNGALCCAAGAGQTDAMLLCEAKGATGWDWALLRAAAQGQCIAIEMCGEKGATMWNSALCDAAAGGQTEAMILCEAKGATEWDEALLSAAGAGQYKAVKLCEEKGAIVWNVALCRAAKGGHEDVIYLCMENGAIDWEGAKREAVKYQHTSVIRLCDEMLGPLLPLRP